jgi:hypothetical protein
MEVREAATRAVAIPVEVKIVVIRAAGHRARAGAKLVPGHPETYQHAQRNLQQLVDSRWNRNLGQP